MIRIEFSWVYIMILKLKLQYCGHLMQRTDSLKRPWCWERLKAGGEGGDRGWDGWMAPPTQWTWVWASSRSWWWTGKPGVLQSMESQSRTRLSHWIELNWMECFHSLLPQCYADWLIHSLIWQAYINTYLDVCLNLSSSLQTYWMRWESPEACYKPQDDRPSCKKDKYHKILLVCGI